jgi:hypothetical protein
MSGNVVTLNPLLPVTDNCFFRKEDIKIGTILVYQGRTEPMTHWRVDDITSTIIRARYMPKNVKVDMVQKLTDRLLLRRITPGGKRRVLRDVTFQYLSYSAIWWVK